MKKFLARDAPRLYPNGRYLFHQDSAPSHTSNATQEFMRSRMRFIPKEKWLPKSPDAAPMDYFVWGYLKSILSRSKPKDMAGLKRALKKAWKDLPLELINKALQSWPKRVYQIYKSKGKNIE